VCVEKEPWFVAEGDLEEEKTVAFKARPPGGRTFGLFEKKERKFL